MGLLHRRHHLGLVTTILLLLSDSLQRAYQHIAQKRTHNNMSLSRWHHQRIPWIPGVLRPSPCHVLAAWLCPAPVPQARSQDRSPGLGMGAPCILEFDQTRVFLKRLDRDYFLLHQPNNPTHRELLLGISYQLRGRGGGRKDRESALLLAPTGGVVATQQKYKGIRTDKNQKPLANICGSYYAAREPREDSKFV